MYTIQRNTDQNGAQSSNNSVTQNRASSADSGQSTEQRELLTVQNRFDPLNKDNVSAPEV